jgi:uncharacterized protein (TIGR00730 family)
VNRLRRVCVYCGSNAGASPVHREAAVALGAHLAQSGIGLVYGGGNVGLMGAIADAALAVDGEVIGVIPASLQEKELGHGGCTELRVVASMHERKQVMADLSDGFIALPGGVGTLEELFETFTWLQLGFHAKPVGLLNVAGFYDRLLEFLRHVAAEQFLKLEHFDCLLVADDAATLLARMAAFRPPQLGKWWREPPAPEQR